MAVYIPHSVYLWLLKQKCGLSHFLAIISPLIFSLFTCVDHNIRILNMLKINCPHNTCYVLVKLKIPKKKCQMPINNSKTTWRFWKMLPRLENVKMYVLCKNLCTRVTDTRIFIVGIHVFHMTRDYSLLNSPNLCEFTCIYPFTCR